MPRKFSAYLNNRLALLTAEFSFNPASDGAWLGILAVRPEVLSGDDRNLLEKQMCFARRVHERALNKARLMLVDEAINLNEQDVHE